MIILTYFDCILLVVLVGMRDDDDDDEGIWGVCVYVWVWVNTMESNKIHIVLCLAKKSILSKYDAKLMAYTKNRLGKIAI